MRSTLLASLVFFAAAPPLFAQTSPPPLISVSSVAEIKVAPDEVVVRAAVITRHANLQDAKKANDGITAKALAFLKEKGIKAEDVQTDYLSIRPDYRNNEDPQEVKYYYMTKSIEVIVRKVDQLEPLVTGLLAQGVNSIEGITFRHSEYRELRIKARAMAVKFAKEKADGLAAELDVKRGKVHKVEAIDDGGSYQMNVYSNRFIGQVSGGYGGGGEGASEGSNGFSVGQISITSRVTASFLIE